MRLANLNVFVPALVVAEFLLKGPVETLLWTLATPFGPFVGLNVFGLSPLPYALIFLAFALVARKMDLSPLTRKPEREQRYRTGHWLIGLTTLAVLLSLGVPVAMAKLVGNNDLMMYLWFALPVIVIATLTWTGGLYMVMSARA